MAAQASPAAPLPVDEVASLVNGIAAKPAAPLQGALQSAAITLTFNRCFTQTDLAALDAHASALLGVQLLNTLITSFWKVGSAATKRELNTKKRCEHLEAHLREKEYVRDDYSTPTASSLLPPRLADTDKGKRLKAASTELAVKAAKEKSSLRSKIFEYLLETYTTEARFACVWATVLQGMDAGALAPFARLVELDNLDKSDYALPGPVFPNDPSREARVNTHLLPGFRSIALSLRQQYDQYRDDCMRREHEAAVKARQEKEERDKNDTEAVKDKNASVASLAANAAEAASQSAMKQLRAENAAMKANLDKCMAQVTLLAEEVQRQQQQQQKGSATTPNSPRGHNTSRPSSPRQGTSARHVTIAPPVTPPRAPRANVDTTQARAPSTPSPKPDAKKAAARQPRQPQVAPSPSKPSQNTRLHHKMAKAAASTTTTTTTPSPIVAISSAPPATLLNDRSSKKKAGRQGNAFAPLANVHPETGRELEPDEDNPPPDFDDELTPETQQPTAQRGKHGGKRNVAHSQTSTGGSARGAPSHR